MGLFSEIAEEMVCETEAKYQAKIDAINSRIESAIKCIKDGNPDDALRILSDKGNPDA